MGSIIAAGDDQVAVDPADGRMVSLIAGGVERLVTTPPAPDDPAAAFQWGCFVMAPWAGRIAEGDLDVAGHHVALERRLGGHAIHGLVMDRPWEERRPSDREIVLTTTFDGPRPLEGTVVHTLRLAPGRLDLELVLTAGDHPLPAWVGWHPCFRRSVGEDDDVAVTLPADHVLVVDDSSLPTGEVVGVDALTDLRDGPVIGARRLDHAYTDVAGPARVRWIDLELVMTVPPPLTAAVVFTAPGLCGVEPQTGWPDAARLAAAGHDSGLRVLDGGQSLRATTTWSWHPVTAP